MSPLALVLQAEVEVSASFQLAVAIDRVLFARQVAAARSVRLHSEHPLASRPLYRLPPGRQMACAIEHTRD